MLFRLWRLTAFSGEIAQPVGCFFGACHLWALPIPVKGYSPLKPRKGIIPLTLLQNHVLCIKHGAVLTYARTLAIRQVAYANQARADSAAHSFFQRNVTI